jgi:HEAT repeat protein
MASQAAKSVTDKHKGLAQLKVDTSTDRLITQAAHFLGVQKKEYVDEACRFYLEHKREEIRRGMAEALADLDDTAASAVSMLTGISVEDLDRLGGFRQDA